MSDTNDELVVTELEKTVEPSTTQANADTPETFDSTPLREFFYGKNTDLTDNEIEDLNIIWGYYSMESNGPGETLGKIRDMERSLSIPPQGVSRVQHILGYVRLMQNEQDLQKAKSAYYG